MSLANVAASINWRLHSLEDREQIPNYQFLKCAEAKPLFYYSYFRSHKLAELLVEHDFGVVWNRFSWVKKKTLSPTQVVRAATGRQMGQNSGKVSITESFFPASLKASCTFFAIFHLSYLSHAATGRRCRVLCNHNAVITDTLSYLMCVHAEW